MTLGRAAQKCADTVVSKHQPLGLHLHQKLTDRVAADAKPGSERRLGGQLVAFGNRFAFDELDEQPADFTGFFRGRLFHANLDSIK